MHSIPVSHSFPPLVTLSLTHAGLPGRHVCLLLLLRVNGAALCAADERGRRRHLKHRALVTVVGMKCWGF